MRFNIHGYLAMTHRALDRRLIRFPFARLDLAFLIRLSSGVNLAALAFGFDKIVQRFLCLIR